MCSGEIGKDRRPGPHHSDVLTAIRFFDEVIAGVSRVVRNVVLTGDVRDVEVGDGDEVQVLLAEIGNEAGKIGKGNRIDGEGTIAKLVIDVEVDGVGGNSVGTQAIGDGAQGRFRRVAVAGLLKAESPEWRKRRRAGEIGISLHHFFGRGAVDEVVAKRTAFGSERIGVAIALAEVEPGAKGVVEEEAVTPFGIGGEKERNAFVDGIGGFGNALIGIP